MAHLGHGCVLQVNSETAPTSSTLTLTSGWSDISAALTDIVPPTVEGEDVDTTHFESTDAFREFIMGLSDGGEAEFTAHYDKTEYATIIALHGLKRAYRVVLDDASTSADSGVAWLGYIKSYTPPIELDGLITMTFTIKVTGKPVHDTDTSA